MLENKYWYKDEYMYFSFAGVHSSKYNLFIENNKGLTIENTIGAQSTFSNAYKQEGTYYLGTSRTQKTFKRKCASRGLTINEYKDMLLWLTPGNTGTLIFDNNKYWGWNVVVDTVGDAEYWNDYGDLVVEFDITFKTIGTYLAHNIYPCIWETINYSLLDNVTEKEILQSVSNSNQCGIPPVIVKPGTDGIEFCIQDIANNNSNFQYNLLFKSILGEVSTIQANLSHIYYNFNIVTNSFDENQISYDSYKFSFYEAGDGTVDKIFTYNSKTGLLSCDGQLAEENQFCNYHKQNNGLIQINTTSPEQILTGKVSTITNGKMTISLTQELQNKLLQYIPDFGYYGKYDYLCVVVKQLNHTPYGVAPYNNNYYYPCYSSVINFNNETVQFGIEYELNNSNNQQDIPTELIINGLDSSIEGLNFILYGGYSNKFKLELKHSSDILLVHDILNGNSNIDIIGSQFSYLRQYDTLKGDYEGNSLLNDGIILYTGDTLIGNSNENTEYDVNYSIIADFNISVNNYNNM